MSTTYQKADEDLTDLLDRVMKEHHPSLATAGVKVGVIMAYNPDGDAIKHGGYPALAKIKPEPLKGRVVKGYDAELLIDEREWRDLKEEQRVSLLDHELSHLALIPLTPKELRAAQAYDSAAPWWRIDDIGRPKLKSVLGDWNTGDGFKAVVMRHGAFAIEYENISRAKAKADAARKEGDAGRAAG